MSGPIDPLSRGIGSERTCSVIYFQKVQGGSLRPNFSTISLQILFILPKFIQIDLNCTPAKNDKKTLRITVKTQFPLTSIWWYEIGFTNQSHFGVTLTATQSRLHEIPRICPYSILRNLWRRAIVKMVRQQKGGKMTKPESGKRFWWEGGLIVLKSIVCSVFRKLHRFHIFCH